MEPARVHLKVADLDRSVAYYQDWLNWQVEHRAGTLAVMRRPAGNYVLVTAGETGDVSAYLHTQHQAARPGDRVYNAKQDLDRLAERLGAAAAWEEDPTLRTILFHDPDGYIVACWEEKSLPDSEVLALYRQGAADLEAALAGLSDAELDLCRAPGKWSIRQTVLHLIDADLSTMQMVKFALAEPGRGYQGNAWVPDTWVAGLDYAHGPIAAEVRLFRAQREHIAGLCERLEGALDRTVVQSGRTWVVRQSLKMVAGHAHGHIQQIWETRRAHGL